MRVLSAVALHLDDRAPRRFLCTSRAPWESRTCDVCTSWFLLCWRQHLNVGAVGCGSGQLSASAERSLAWTIGPALIAELASEGAPLRHLGLLPPGGTLPVPESGLDGGLRGCDLCPAALHLSSANIPQRRLLRSWDS